MAYDEGLAERVRDALRERGDVTEKRMFGGLAVLVRGHMSVGVLKDDLMVRVGPEDYDRLVREPHARAMDFTGRPMKGFVFVDVRGLERDADLERWVGRGVAYAASLPPKPGPRLNRASRGRARRKKAALPRSVGRRP